MKENNMKNSKTNIKYLNIFFIFLLYLVSDFIIN